MTGNGKVNNLVDTQKRPCTTWRRVSPLRALNARFRERRDVSRRSITRLRDVKDRA